ncbi:MAG: cache domain-containing protein, partial [Oscillospiraceae bacterium]
MIYSATEYGVKTEIQTAARTLKLMCEEYTRDKAPRENTCEIGSIDITPEEFISITGCIGTSSDVYFTIFRGDTRVFTSVKNSDGSLAVGTKVSDEVTEAVLKNNSEYFFQKISVNGRYYIGYYIPVTDLNDVGVGMVFAGKPLDIAQKDATRVTGLFIIISVATLI